jgi:carbamoyl-phosphate synthase large subunit
MITVMITAIGGGGHGEQILKALRFANNGNYRIIGADSNPYCPQFALVDVPVVLPTADKPDFLDAVMALADKYQIKALFHGCEPEMQVFSRERKRIEEAGIFLPINPAGVLSICTDKIALAQFLADHHFNPPAYWVLATPSDISSVEQYPVIVKPFKNSGGSKNCFIAQNTSELEHILGYLGWPEDIMAQEYIGTQESEFTVGVLSDMNGNFINSIALRRYLYSQLNVRIKVPNRTGRKELGPFLFVSSGISHGQIGVFPEVTEPCERIAKAIGSKGPLNIQCRLDSDNQVRVFEINPRFSGTTSIRAMVGYNEPDILLRTHFCNDKIAPRFAYDHRIIIRNIAETIIAEKAVDSWTKHLS